MAERSRNRGELENEILQILWSSVEEMSARQVQAEFDGQVPAYTTILTTLDRLTKKGLVTRSGPSPRKLRFRAAMTEEEHRSQAMTEVLQSATDREAALLSFAGNLNPEDVELLKKALGS